MRVLARLIGPDERVVTIEEQAELHLGRELADCISLEGRLPNTEGRGAITIQMLVHEALRMSPDRIVIGEVRGGEALCLLDAMNTGHPELWYCGANDRDKRPSSDLHPNQRRPGRREARRRATASGLPQARQAARLDGGEGLRGQRPQREQGRNRPA